MASNRASRVTVAMTWDELCLISAIRPNGCPTQFMAPGQIMEASSRMASEILKSGSTPYLDKKTLKSILRNTLQTAWRSKETDGMPEWLPRDSYVWSGFDTAIAIGYFDADGECPTYRSGRRYLIPRGPGVAVQRVRQPDAGEFEILVLDDPEIEGGEIEEDVITTCSSAYHSWCPNFFILEGPYLYLKAWLDKDIPPSSCRPAMAFAEELYEIVNSRIETRYHGIGLLPEIEYGPITKTHNQFQLFFLGARIIGSPHTAKAIAAGLKDEELIPALKNDFQCWLFMRPDIWPVPIVSSTLTHCYTPYSTIPVTSFISILPTELVLQIVRYLPLTSVLSLSSTSKSIRNHITDTPFINQVIKEAMVEGGPLYWVHPVPDVRGEMDRAQAVDKVWMQLSPTPASIEDGSMNEAMSRPFTARGFPYHAFFQACHNSDSMRNRKRLWDNVKQFDILRRDFRRFGWERDDFISEGPKS